MTKRRSTFKKFMNTLMNRLKTTTVRPTPSTRRHLVGSPNQNADGSANSHDAARPPEYHQPFDELRLVADSADGGIP
jgi:hypothetical protein